MDPTSIILPGIQSLVTNIMNEGWLQARQALARRWSKKSSIDRNSAEQRLQDAYQQSMAVAGSRQDRAVVLEAYWAGYFAGLAAEHPELLDVIARFGLQPRKATATVQNVNTGRVGALVQLGEAHGDINIQDR
jgi:hypothetical protein